MKILFINEFFYPDVAATAQQLDDFTAFLVKSGHQVTVLCSRSDYTASGQRYASYETRQGVEIYRVAGFHFGRNSKLARILSALSLNTAFAWKLLQISSYDLVVSLTSPPLVAWAASLICQWKKMLFSYWVMDLNPDEAIEAGWIKKDSLQAKWLTRALKSVIKRSKKIVVLDRFMKQRMIMHGALEAQVEICPPWSHDDELEYVSKEKNLFLKQHGLENRFVVMYSGNHSICHPLDTLLETAKTLKDDSRFAFVFIGGGARVKDVLHYKNAYGLNHVFHFPYQPRSELKYSLSAADMHVVVMGNPFVGIVHPSKIYGILRLARPFFCIGPKEGHLTDLMQQYRIGFQIAHGESSRLTEFLQQQLTASQVQDLSFQQAAKQSAQSFSAATLMPRLKNILTV